MPQTLAWSLDWRRVRARTKAIVEGASPQHVIVRGIDAV
jgi:hypothetical protein